MWPTTESSTSVVLRQSLQTCACAHCHESHCYTGWADKIASAAEEEEQGKTYSQNWLMFLTVLFGKGRLAAVSRNSPVAEA